MCLCIGPALANGMLADMMQAEAWDGLVRLTCLVDLPSGAF